jgi:hypothetical protein
MRLPAQVRRLLEPHQAVVEVLRSLALKGRRFETWDEVHQAIREATAHWNAYRHPFIWGRRRRHQPHRKSGVGLAPQVA